MRELSCAPVVSLCRLLLFIYSEKVFYTDEVAADF